jgi:hypothetical protein
VGMADYERAVTLMAEHAAKSRFVGPRPHSLVEAAEKALSAVFPPTYRRFVLEYGAGNFGTVEILGVTKDNFQSGSVPNGIWYTLLLRKEFGLPVNLVVVQELDDEGLACIDLSTRSSDGEAPVVLYYPASHQTSLTRLSEDFGSYLLEQVQGQVRRWAN